MSARFKTISAMASLCLCISAASAAPLGAERVASGFDLPLYVTAAPGDADRLFVVEQRDGTTGRIQVLNKSDGSVNSTPFLEVPNVNTAGEQGLLGLAFDPDYQTNGRFYINYTTDVGGNRTVIQAHTVSGDPAVADPGGTEILTWDQPASNHNGGWMGFNPNDGNLYIASGDGGGAPGNRAQELDNLLGKIVRISPNGSGYDVPSDNPFTGDAEARDEIWSYGLRNPYRASFDRANGDLWIGDVGTSQKEEVNYQPEGVDGGQNYGWPAKEGTDVRTTPVPDDVIDPLYEYDHIPGGAIMGGYVYRGPSIPELDGKYLFGEFATGQVWALSLDGEDVTVEEITGMLTPEEGSIDSITSFGEDNEGNLYIVDRDGEIFMIVPEPATLALLSLGGLALLRRRKR